MCSTCNINLPSDNTNLSPPKSECLCVVSSWDFTPKDLHKSSSSKPTWFHLLNRKKITLKLLDDFIVNWTKKRRKIKLTEFLLMCTDSITIGRVQSRYKTTTTELWFQICVLFRTKGLSSGFSCALHVKIVSYKNRDVLQIWQSVLGRSGNMKIMCCLSPKKLKKTE